MDELVEAVVSQNAPWPRTGLLGKWRLAYLQPGPNGEGVDRRVPFPEFGFNEQYQIFSRAGSQTWARSWVRPCASK